MPEIPPPITAIRFGATAGCSKGIGDVPNKCVEKRVDMVTRSKSKQIKENSFDPV
jgi:hypothetical protein